MEDLDVQLGAVRIHVQRWGDGSGPGILYWHGGGGGSEEAPLLAPALVAAGHTVHAVDAPGYGSSTALEPEGYAMPAIAELARDLVDRLELIPVIWIGYSWGAAVGVHTAARFPAAIRGLALLDGGYLVAQDDPEYNPDTDYEDEVAELRVRAQAGESWDAPHEVIGAAMVASRNAPCVPVYPALRQTRIPVLLAHATEPRELQPLRERAVDRFRAALPEADVRAVPNATHGILQDNGPEVIRVLLDWLDGVV
jgi:pimeloyl-ACP methyl ester carboxylesterase